MCNLDTITTRSLKCHFQCIGYAPMIYELSAKGQAFLEHRDLLSLRATTLSRRSRGSSNPQFEHALMIVDVLVSTELLLIGRDHQRFVGIEEILAKAPTKTRNAANPLSIPYEAQKFSKALTYRHGGDKNGWSATKMLRLIGSINHKPEYDEPIVQTVACDWTKIASRPLPLDRKCGAGTSIMLDVDANPNKHKRSEVLKKYRKDLHAKVRYLIGNRKVYEPNRSAQIFHMIAGLHEAGATHDEIACVLWDNPYFVEKHGRDLSKLNEEISRVISKLEAKQ